MRPSRRFRQRRPHVPKTRRAKRSYSGCAMSWPRRTPSWRAFAGGWRARALSSADAKELERARVAFAEHSADRRVGGRFELGVLGEQSIRRIARRLVEQL